MIIYLPIELKAREFASKLLLALELVSKGFTVVFGQQWLIFRNLDRLPRGLILFKGFNKVHAQRLLRAKMVGHVVAAHDEEHLGAADEAAIRASLRGYPREAPDLIIAHGEFERAVIQRELGLASSKLAVCGSCRVDILRPEFRVLLQEGIDRIKRTFGDYLLVNTNFGLINSIWGDQIKQVYINTGFLKEENIEDEKAFEEQLRWETHNRSELIAAIKKLSVELDHLKIIIRPHPAEVIDFWNGVFSGHGNVHVIREGEHTPWTLASKCLIHTSCTTGFEASVARSPSISLTPNDSKLNDRVVTNRVNPTAANYEQLKELVDLALSDSSTFVESKMSLQKLDGIIANVSGRLAVSAFVDALCPLVPGGAPSNMTATNIIHFERSEILKYKFSASLAETRALLEKFMHLFKRAGNYELVKLGDSLFSLRAIARA